MYRDSAPSDYLDILDGTQVPWHNHGMIKMLTKKQENWKKPQATQVYSLIL